MSVLARLVIAAALMSSLAAPARADPVEDFYRGKQIKIYIRAAPGGNYDIYSRVLGRHMSHHIPGNPTFVPINMPGGGGIVALNYVANVAPKDGTALTMITASFPMDQALGTQKSLTIDLKTLNWIGNMSNTSTVFFTKKDSATKTLDDAKKRETFIAATGIASIVTQLAAVYNNRLGTRLKVIYGYPSGPDMTLAVERGEVEGRTTSNPHVLAGPGAPKSDVLALYHFLIQTGMKKLKDYEEVPLLRELATNDDDRKIFDFISAAVALSRPIVTTAGVPPERLAALRRAFDAALADPAFLKEADAQALEISPMSGDELTRLVGDMLATPRDVLEKVAQAIDIKAAAEAARGVKPGSGGE